MNNQIFEIREHLRSKLHPMRYEHTLGVSFTCMALAMRYGYDLDKAEMAGLLHDCAKRYDDTVIIRKCEKKGIELTEGERMAPATIHAKLGAYLAEHKYGVTDPEILNAIACHTTGKPGMGLLDKILYVADYIEPRRDRAPQLPEMRRLAFEDLDEALFQIMEGILDYLSASGTYIDEMTRNAYEYYRELRSCREQEAASQSTMPVREEERTSDFAPSSFDAAKQPPSEERAPDGAQKEEKKQYAFKRISKNRHKGTGRQKRRRY